MGNCIPTKNITQPLPPPPPPPPPAMKLKSLESQGSNLQIESPFEGKFNSKIHFSSPIPCEKTTQGNREEMYFDSETWLDSDVEDYLSVNGDLTPLGSTSPLHQSKLKKNPDCDESICIYNSENPISETPKANIKKQVQLIELFRESFNKNEGNQKNNFQNKVEPKSSKYTNKQESSTQCCLPNLVRSLSFSERKRRLNNRGGR